MNVNQNFNLLRPLMTSAASSHSCSTIKKIIPTDVQSLTGSDITTGSDQVELASGALEAEIREAFSLFDDSGRGCLARASVRNAVKALGFDRKSIDELVRVMDPEKTGYVAFPAFRQVMLEKIQQLMEDVRVRRVNSVKAGTETDRFSFDELRDAVEELSQGRRAGGRAMIRGISPSRPLRSSIMVRDEVTEGPDDDIIMRMLLAYKMERQEEQDRANEQRGSAKFLNR